MKNGRELCTRELGSDWPSALVAMVGGIGGALICATGAIPQAVPLVAWLMFGTMLGSGTCVLVWYLLEDQ